MPSVYQDVTKDLSDVSFQVQIHMLSKEQLLGGCRFAVCS